MKKKILILSVSLLMLMMLATLIVNANGVKRNISQDFAATLTMCDPTTTPPGSFVPGITKFVGPKDSAVPEPNPANPENRRYMLMMGWKFTGVISGLLGNGVAESTLILLFNDCVPRTGWAIYKLKWQFDNEVCVGTIEGTLKYDLEIDGTQTPPIIYTDGSALLCKGAGDLHNVKIQVSWEAALNRATYLTKGYTATMEGTIWGWNP
jgi:hypothetical protein